MQLSIGHNDCVRYQWRGLEMWLHPDRAVFMPQYRALLLADLHLGKANHFRKSGVGVPLGTRNRNHQRLGRLLHDFTPAKVFFLGDLFHSFYNASWKEFENFLMQYRNTDFMLIKGNHDILPQEAYESAALNLCGKQLELDEMLLAHHPPAPEEVPSEKPWFCGHVHPGVKLRGKGRQGIKVPCFFFSGNCCILPAFGEFTGLALMRPGKNDTVFGLVGEKVIPLVESAKS